MIKSIKMFNQIETHYIYHFFYLETEMKMTQNKEYIGEELDDWINEKIKG